MEIHDRIKQLRTGLKLSQEKFGERLGVSRDVINNIERNRLSRPEQKEPIYKLICNEFHVNEDWLRTGAGGDDNMLVPDDMQLYLNIGKLSDSDNDFKKLCVETIIDMPNEFFDRLYEAFVKYEKTKKE